MDPSPAIHRVTGAFGDRGGYRHRAADRDDGSADEDPRVDGILRSGPPHGSSDGVSHGADRAARQWGAPGVTHCVSHRVTHCVSHCVDFSVDFSVADGAGHHVSHDFGERWGRDVCDK